MSVVLFAFAIVAAWSTFMVAVVCSALDAGDREPLEARQGR